MKTLALNVRFSLAKLEPSLVYIHSTRPTTPMKLHALAKASALLPVLALYSPVNDLNDSASRPSKARRNQTTRPALFGY
jgi:hypothetical protein